MHHVEYGKGLHQVGSNVYAYLQPDGSWGWSNAGLIVAGEQALLVDTLYDLDLTAEMLQTMNVAISTPNPLSIGTLINTHANGDHTFGNELVVGAEIISSAHTAEEMRKETSPAQMAQLLKLAPQLGKAGEYFFQAFSKFKYEAVHLTLPTRTFVGELSLKVGQQEVQLMEVGPAHTQGDTIVYIPATKTVFTGDILFIGGHPIMWAGPIGNWIKACDKILSLDVEVIVPGHGPVTDKAGVLKFREYLEYMTEQAKLGYDKGLDAFETAKELFDRPSPYSAWANRERMVITVDTLYREFKGPSSPPLDVLALFGKMGQLALP
jgi:glyoxylase-like metal-dependent hydrolase (beta-lactamase superfamily II)